MDLWTLRECLDFTRLAGSDRAWKMLNHLQLADDACATQNSRRLAASHHTRWHKLQLGPCMLGCLLALLYPSAAVFSKAPIYISSHMQGRYTRCAQPPVYGHQPVIRHECGCLQAAFTWTVPMTNALAKPAWALNNLSLHSLTTVESDSNRYCIGTLKVIVILDSLVTFTASLYHRLVIECDVSTLVRLHICRFCLSICLIHDYPT